MKVFCRVIARALCAGGVLLAVGSVSAGELVPYAPPVRQSAPSSVQAVPRTAAPARLPEDTYRRFAQETRGLTPADRAVLARSLEQSRAAAAREGDSARELHYLRLLDSLRVAKGGQ